MMTLNGIFVSNEIQGINRVYIKYRISMLHLQCKCKRDNESKVVCLASARKLAIHINLEEFSEGEKCFPKFNCP